MRHRPVRAAAALLSWLAVWSVVRARPDEIRDRQVFNVSGSPYEIKRDIVVVDGGELVIEPGVELRFAPGVGIFVNGALKAQVGRRPSSSRNNVKRCSWRR